MSITRVQGGVLVSTGGSPSVASANFAAISAVGNGNTICGMISHDDASAITSIVDDKGNTYFVETDIDDTTNAQFATGFSRSNITNGPTVITVNFAPNATFVGGVLDEFSGTFTGSSDGRDGTAHGGQFQNAPPTTTDGVTSGTFTTVTNGDLLWGGTMSAAQLTDPSVGTGFASGSTMNTDYGIFSEWAVQAIAGSGTAATFTRTPSTQQVTVLIAVKPAFVSGGLMPQIWM